MKAVTSILLVILLGSGCPGALGQDRPRTASETPKAFSNDPEVKRWKAALQALESVDVDPATPPAIRERNLRTLQQRRNDLQVLIKSKIFDLQRYKDRLMPQGEVLATEIKETTSEISNLQRDLEDIQKGKTAGQADTGTVKPGVVAKSQESKVQEGNDEQVSDASPATSENPDEAATPRTAPGGSSPPGGSAPGGAGPGRAAQVALSLPDCTTFEKNPRTFSILDKYSCELANNIRSNKADDPQAGLEARADLFSIALIAVARKDRPDYLVEAEEKRVDKQVGAGPSSSGTTSLTVKGSGPKILGLAVENGALTQSTSGTTITFRGNPLGIAQALANKGYLESYDQAEKYVFTRFLKKLSFSASFDTSRGQMTEAMEGMPPPMPVPNVFTADRQQLSEVAVRYEIYNQRDPRSKRYRADWEAFLNSQANRSLALASASLVEKLTITTRQGQIKVGPSVVRLMPATKLVGANLIKNNANICVTRLATENGVTATITPNTSGTEIRPDPAGGIVRVVACGVVKVQDFIPPSPEGFAFKDEALQKWFVGTQEALRDAGSDEVEAVLRQRLDEMPVDQLSPETMILMRNVSVGFDNYLKAKQMIIDKINQGGVVTFEYTNTRNVDSPNLSNFRLIAEKGAGGKFDATFNGSLTIFDKLPMGVTKRIRDFQFSGQGDLLLADMGDAGNIVLSFSGRYERLMEDAMTPDGMMVMDTKGDIAIGQAKLTIPVKGGFKIPISVTFANRTELIKEKEVRGNIGFTFDLDALFARFKL